MKIRVILNLLSGALVIPGALLSAGTLLPALPYVGTAGSWVLPASAGRYLILGTIGAAIAAAAWRPGARRAGTALIVLGLFTAVTAAIVIGSHALVASRNGARVDLLAAVLHRGPLPRAAPDTTVIYTHVGREPLHMDLYQPARPASGPAPVVLYVHGGGWIRGDRTAQAPALRWFAEQGFLAVSPDYVLARKDAPTWNTAAAQIACAMAWIAQHAHTYGGDPRRLAVFGESAGGALALTATYAAAAGVARPSCGSRVPIARAVAAQYPAVDPVTFHDNPNPLLRSRAREMVGTYLGGSPSEYPERARAVSSDTYITPGAPPTLIFLAASDHLVPIAGAQRFMEKAQRAGVNLRAVRFPWADHSIQSEPRSVASQSMRQIMRQHFCQHLGGC